jgi:heme/copper-type cytochrome/quinol oxidase subunit 1
MKLKPIVSELLILAGLFVIAWLIQWTAISVFLGNSALDINLHDTYFVASGNTLGIPLLLITVVFAVKESFYGYKRKIPNLVLLASVFLVNIQVIFDSKIVVSLANIRHGWTIYPPLSAIPREPPTLTTQPSPFVHLYQLFLSIQIFFLVLLVIIAVLTGKNWNIRQGEN